MTGVAKVFSVAPVGFDGQLIEVESDLKNGLPSLQIVGLGSKAIDEAKERVRSAITNSLLDFPAKKIIINLAPAELPKDGALFDVPIALALLTASGQLSPHETVDAVFAGELALDGSIRPIRGAISIAETARAAGKTIVYLPTDNVEQASLVSDVDLIPIQTLQELFLHLKGERRIPTYQSSPREVSKVATAGPTLDDVHGQETAKRALTIAAAGHHNILFTGSPGAGKTMLAQTLVSLLPPLTDDESLAVTKLHSLAGEMIDRVVSTRPFRSPHHTASRVALIGGGAKPKPGEISLAHFGVLFLDEIPEYPRATLEALRQPLEDHKVSISRANGHITYPAQFMLVATMNPCPCGYYGDPRKECRCSSSQILAYQQRLSGPMLDRIDMVIPVSPVKNQELLLQKNQSKSQQKTAYTHIEKAHKQQLNRYKSSSVYNSSLSSRDAKQIIKLQPDSIQLLSQATERLGLSARSYFKLMKVARTIADLELAPDVTTAHIAEAIQYRPTT